MADDNKDDEKLTPEQQKRRNIGNAVGGVLTMLPTIAGTIPGLRQSRQTGRLNKMAEGRGPGAQTAIRAGARAGRAVSGNLGGRGSQGLVRSGIRASERIASEAASQAARIGAVEGMAGTRALMADENRRRRLGLQLGAGLGQAGGGILATLLAAKDQGPRVDSPAANLAEVPEPMLDEPGELNQSGMAPAEAPMLEANTSLQPNDMLQQYALPEPGQAPQAGEGFGQAAVQGQFDNGLAIAPALTGGSVQATPEEKARAGREQYLAHNVRPKERPLRSAGGSDQRVLDDLERRALLLSQGRTRTQGQP